MRWTTGNPPPIHILAEVATGPASAVFVARVGDSRAAPLCAVKVLRVRSPGDVELLLEARDAGRALARLGHRHILVAEEVAAVGGFPALITPWVEGVDLLDWMEVLREQGLSVPARVVCEIVRSVATALDAAQRRLPPGDGEPLGVLHRDLKPTNMLIDRDGELKVLDFGTGFTSIVGRAARGAALQKGLIKYMAPERREGRGDGPEADVYALGILAIELLRGRWLRRLRGQNPAHDRHLAEVVASLGELGARTSADDATLRTTLLRMSAFDEEARPTAGEVAHTFRMLADRTAGPSLESFAHEHALPCVKPVAARPDPALAGIEVRLLDSGAKSSDLPAPDGFQASALLQRKADGEVDWEESEGGWRHASLDDDEDTSAPPPQVLGTTGAAPGEASAPRITMMMAPPERPPAVDVEVETARDTHAPRLPAPVARPMWPIALAVVALGGLALALGGAGLAWWYWSA